MNLDNLSVEQLAALVITLLSHSFKAEAHPHAKDILVITQIVLQQQP